MIEALGAGALGVLVMLFVLFVLVTNSVKILPEYERGVVFRLGRLRPKDYGPGLFFLIPIADRMVRVPLRTVVHNVPPQDVITRDNVSVKVNAVVYYRVIDPRRAVVEVEYYPNATSMLAQTMLRSVLGQHELDELLSQRNRLNAMLQEELDRDTEPWGIKVSKVEVKDVDLPPDMQRAMAKQAEAEREKRAKIIHAEGEFQASMQLSEGGRPDLVEPDHHPAAVPADADGDRHREELDDRLPDPDRPHQVAPRSKVMTGADADPVVMATALRASQTLDAGSFLEICAGGLVELLRPAAVHAYLRAPGGAGLDLHGSWPERRRGGPRPPQRLDGADPAACGAATEEEAPDGPRAGAGEGPAADPPAPAAVLLPVGAGPGPGRRLPGLRGRRASRVRAGRGGPARAL